jgi:transcriptional regulator with XRE-family HTH domain
MNVYEKIKLIEKKSGLKTKEFCESLNIPYVTYNNYVTGKREMPLSKVIQMCNIYNINCNWLLKDKGEMFDSEPIGEMSLTNEELKLVEKLLSKIKAEK